MPEWHHEMHRRTDDARRERGWRPSRFSIIVPCTPFDGIYLFDRLNDPEGPVERAGRFWHVRSDGRRLTEGRWGPDQATPCSLAKRVAAAREETPTFR